MKLRIVQIPVRPLQMNATLVMDKKTKETIFFDPGDETVIYPGHGPKTILGEERKYNPYINGTLRLV